MRIVEFRIILPLKLEQCQKACVYSCYKLGAETKGQSASEGVEFVESRDYDENGEKGHYTHKILHLKSFVPAVIRWVVPDKYLHIAEKSHDGFPHYFTEYDMPGMGPDFVLTTEGKHFDYTSDCQLPENSFNYTEEELAQREIRYLDILDGPYQDAEVSLQGFSFPEEGIQLMTGNGKYNEKEPPAWTKTYKGPMTCCSKAVKFHFHWRGIQTAVEAFVLNSSYTQVFLKNHRGMVKWAPEWHKVTLEEIINMEKAKLDEDKNKQYD